MIRKNDSLIYIGKWGKTITPKINWHISRHSVYNHERKRKNMIKVNKGNWGRNGIGIHYQDGTNRYEKRLISEYEVLKKIQKVIKKQKNISGVVWSDKIVYKSYENFKKIIHMAENIAHKYGFKLQRNEEYEEYFPYIILKRETNKYIYPYL